MDAPNPPTPDFEDDDYDGPDPLMPNATREERLAEIFASLERSKADMAAGRLVDVDVAVAEVRAMIAEYRRTGRVDGPADD